MSKVKAEDSVGDVKVGELGFGSVAEGGSFIAVPNASEEIKLEGGGGSLSSGANSKVVVDKAGSKESKRSGKGSTFLKEPSIQEKSEVEVREVGDEGLEETKIGGGSAESLAAGEDAFGDSASSAIEGESIGGGGGGGGEGSIGVGLAEESVSVNGGKIGANSITSSLLEEERVKYKELVKLNRDQHAAHLEEVERLTSLVSDLSRRLQNAKHTVDASRKVSKNATDSASRFRHHIGQVSNALRLETAKNSTTQRKKLHAEEAQRFELNKRKATKAHDNVRMAILDHSMTGMKNPTQKIINMKKSIKKMETEHESQKLLLQHLTQMERMTEDLTEASQHGELAKCLECLKKGVSANEPDSAGYLPLHYAASNGHADAAKLLMEYGADPTSYLTGHSSIEMAARHGFTDIVKTIIYFGGSTEDKGLRGSTPLVSAASGDYVETVVALLNAGADIQGTNLEENTALHEATALDNPVPLIRLLLKRGADITSINRDGHTPVRKAIANANALAVDALGGRAAMVDMKDEDLLVSDNIGDEPSLNATESMAGSSGVMPAGLDEYPSVVSALTQPEMPASTRPGKQRS